jgi:hypothetical protein
MVSPPWRRGLSPTLPPLLPPERALLPGTRSFEIGLCVQQSALHCAANAWQSWDVDAAKERVAQECRDIS